MPFVKESCVVYASFNSETERIKKVSKSFQDIFQIENSLIIGKHIDYLIPKALKDSHAGCMLNFRNKGFLNTIT